MRRLRKTPQLDEVELLRTEITVLRAALALALDDCIAQAVYWSSGDPEETSSTVRAVKAALAIQPDDALASIVERVKECYSELVRDVLRDTKSTLSYDDASEIQKRIHALEIKL